jgi:hypothetical protein
VIIVDTNVWSETLRAEPDPHVLRWFRANAADLYIPALVVHELVFGIELLPNGRKRTQLEPHVHAMIARIARRVLPYDADTARTHAELRAGARLAGREPSAQDGQIAAHAAHHNAALATRNTTDFTGLNITLINPWDVR